MVISASIGGTCVVTSSPKITSLSWGKISVEGLGGADGTSSPLLHRDAKLFPGGSREWDWGETGTQHSPGIHRDDVDEILEAGANIVILSQGVRGRLKVRPETVSKLEGRGVRVEVLRTERAVERYNNLAESGEAVGALIHSTC